MAKAPKQNIFRRMLSFMQERFSRLRPPPSHPSDNEVTQASSPPPSYDEVIGNPTSSSEETGIIEQEQKIKDIHKGIEELNKQIQQASKNIRPLYENIRQQEQDKLIQEQEKLYKLTLRTAPCLISKNH